MRNEFQLYENIVLYLQDTEQLLIIGFHVV